MDNNYINVYIETLTNTLTEAVIRNISLQATNKISDNVVQENSKEIQLLKSQIDELSNALKAQSSTESNKVVELENTIAHLRNELNESRRINHEYENVKHQLQHVDTFRNELLKEREEHQRTRNDYEVKIEELNNKIEYLQLPSAKRKKMDDSKKIETNDSILPVTKDDSDF
jgi:chromosome segregation ATPase